MINILMFLALFSVINIFPLKKKSLSRATGPAVNMQAADRRPSLWSGLVLGGARSPRLRQNPQASEGTGGGRWEQEEVFCTGANVSSTGVLLPLVFFPLSSSKQKKRVRADHMHECILFQMAEPKHRLDCRSTDTKNAGRKSSQLQLLKPMAANSIH